MGQQLANENKTIRFGRGQVKLHCFKLNPEVITKLPRAKLTLPEIPILIIPNLKSYYNLHTNENFQIRTSILANTGKSFELFIKEAVTGQNINSVLKFKGSVLIKDKFLNIQKNLGNKEIFFKTLAKKKSALALESLNNTPSCSQETMGTTIQFSNDLPTPVRCQERIEINKGFEKPNPHGEICCVTTKFSINQIKDLNGNAVLDELYAHAHAKYLKLPRNKTRDLSQAKEELTLHYKKYHTGQKIDPSKPNTSKNLT
jgi:hypothetical protein